MPRCRSGVPSPPLIGGGEGQGEVGDRRNGLGQRAAWCDFPEPLPRGPAPPHPGPLRPMAGRRGGVAAAEPSPASGLRPSHIRPDTLHSRSSVPSPPPIGGGEGQGEVGDRCNGLRQGRRHGATFQRHCRADPPRLTPVLSAPCGAERGRGGGGERPSPACGRGRRCTGCSIGSRSSRTISPARNPGRPRSARNTLARLPGSTGARGACRPGCPASARRRCGRCWRAIRW
jgi:hypothetical protein